MLNPSMRVAPTMQFDLRPEDEGVLAAIPTKEFIEELVELLPSWARLLVMN